MRVMRSNRYAYCRTVRVAVRDAAANARVVDVVGESLRALPSADGSRARVASSPA